MREQYVSRTAVATAALWAAAGVALVGAWVAYFATKAGSLLPRLCMVTAVVLAIAALTTHIRWMTCRVMTLIRHTSGLDGDSGRLHSIRQGPR